MKQIKISALVLAAASIASTGAMAQSSKANAWEGAYGQVGVGFGIFTPTIGGGAAQYPSPLSTIPATASASNVSNVNTGLINLAGGYNFGISESYILGIGASYYPGASSSAAGTLNATLPSPYSAYNASASASYNVKNLYNVFLSPGYAFDKDRLAYLKVGYTGASIGLSGPTIPYSSTNLSGYTLGLGYKQMLTSSFYAFGEVNYASYGSKNLASTTTTTGLTVSGMTLSGTGTDFLVGIGYRF